MTAPTGLVTESVETLAEALREVPGIASERHWSEHIAAELIASGAVRPAAEVRAEALRSPYDEDGYCESCGNGSWKPHAPECGWADLRDARAEVRAEVKAAVEEWFTDVSLDDLFAVKGWALAEEGGDP